MAYKVSIILNAYNEEQDLPSCIKSLKEMTIKPYEILVIDNGSTDNTAKVAKEMGAKVHTIKPRSRGLARDYGLRVAKGNIVAWLDSDMTVNKVWLEEILKKFDNGADTVLDRIRVYKPNTYYSKALDSLYTFRYNNNYKPWVAYMFRKEVLEELGGWGNVWIADAELGKRILAAGYKITLSYKSERYHKGPPRKCKDMIKRSYFFGKQLSYSIYKKFPGTFPTKRIGAYLFFILLEIIAISASLFNILFLIWVPISFVLLFFGLWAKFLFIDQAIGKIPLFETFVLNISTFIRALIWPAGVIVGMIFKENSLK